ncbi:HNH endonuclease signature motif containing protein [soil metagenome]
MHTGVVGSGEDPIGGRGAPVATLAGAARRSMADAAVEFADVSVMGDSELRDAFRDVEAAERQAVSARLSLIAEIDARGLTMREDGLNTGAWLGHEFGQSRPVINATIGVARTLRRTLPTTGQALFDGSITFEHARLLCRLATGRIEAIVVALEPTLIALADGVRFERWATDVRRLIDTADPDGGHSPGPENNRLSMTDGLSGELHLDIDLHGAAAASTRAILFAELERRYDAHRRLANADDEHVTPTRAALFAEAHTDLLRKGAAASAGTTAPVTDVTMIINASDPVNGSTPDGVRLQDDTTRLLMCSAAIHALVINSLGVPIDMGTLVRFFTPAQQRAIRARDGGCGHPGCDVPQSWTQIHHVDEVARDHGETNLALGVLACPIHHELWHQPGWTLTPDITDDTQGFIITTPTGKQLRTQRHGRPRPER